MCEPVEECCCHLCVHCPATHACMCENGAMYELTAMELSDRGLIDVARREVKTVRYLYDGKRATLV